MAENLVTQVTQDVGGDAAAALTHEEENMNIDYNSKIHLNIRGKAFSITRDELMSLPESILLSLFPNGVFLDFNGQVISKLTEEDVVFVNFDPASFEYILRTFGDAHADLQGMTNLSPQISENSHLDSSPSVLQTKPAIIVLREDLDYYVIPPSAGCSSEDIKHLKLEVANKLMENKMIFSGLGYDTSLPSSITQKLGPAEQHLLDMLCSSGFERRESWGSRSLEPSKCVLQSLLLIRLANPLVTPPDSPSLNPVSSHASTRSRSRSRIATLASSASRAASRSMSRARKNTEINHSKLLLFWKKPARKCWWSNEEIEVQVAATGLSKLGDNVKVKVHIRRVWTLELSVIGVQ
ncbi:hypothetical protein METBIDRAFT_178465 [Metschnikowia bicuspidata var. bicuspidata NRRL YB-4993]|uniref:Growth regulation protein n=1 Tax=Metschnikowia bicuspidata var. bicuspidata NRRL YB-4993 TaxID=869754 RepID=A0A1A0HB66_9ASCO|nr:hypothetical protein METBIDRAFT_178465 [Metschnikowia bicuspidata var. bicuspidata NRRL YB-4993]OBA21230.1 hypothetical protein METBIDRAFT_178465 [Metschnikowia bicuspidata var. bicuspidata NRRL YB-4993]